MSENKEDFQVDGVYIQDKDMNNNGIPDEQERQSEPAAEPEVHHPERIDWDPQVASAYAYTRSHRDAQSHHMSTYDVSDDQSRDEQARNRTNAAERDKSAFEQAVEADPNKAIDNKSFRDALHNLQIRRLQTPKRHKSSLQAELSRVRPPKEEPKSGLELGHELIKGLLAGAKAQVQRKKEIDFDRDLKKAEKLILDNAAEKDLSAAKQANDNSGPSGGAGPENGPAAPGGGVPNDGTDAGAQDGEPKAASSENSPPLGALQAKPSVQSPEASSPEQEPKKGGELGTVASAEATGADGRDRRVDAAVAVNDISRSDAASLIKSADHDAESLAHGTKSSSPDRKPDTPSNPARGEVSPADANGNAGLGATASIINPVAGPAITAIQTHGAQKAAGLGHGPAKVENSAAPLRPILSVRPARQPKPANLGIAPQNTDATKVPFKKAEARKGVLHAQAASLPRAAPIPSKGPSLPTGGGRTIGLGMSISGYILNAARGNDGKGVQQGPDLLAAYMKQRDQSGRGF